MIEMSPELQSNLTVIECMQTCSCIGRRLGDNSCTVAWATIGWMTSAAGLATTAVGGTTTDVHMVD